MPSYFATLKAAAKKMEDELIIDKELEPILQALIDRYKSETGSEYPRLVFTCGAAEEGTWLWKGILPQLGSEVETREKLKIFTKRITKDVFDGDTSGVVSINRGKSRGMYNLSEDEIYLKFP